MDLHSELLPAKVPGCRRATLLLVDLTGFDHAMPSSDLVEQIAKLGLLQPIVVAASAKRRYRVIEGRRRAKAVQLLAAEGCWPSPPRLNAVIVQGLEGAELVPAGVWQAWELWSQVERPDRILAFAAYGEAVDREEHAARTLAECADLIRRRLR
ncbi:MAG: ParB N-terminal domain-containing protein [Solirubrobacterales bacterium]|nr:ParB N-terminal domain-containing protein [Solirubrobacterales bacterium]